MWIIFTLVWNIFKLSKPSQKLNKSFGSVVAQVLCEKFWKNIAYAQNMKWRLSYQYLVTLVSTKSRLFWPLFYTTGFDNFGPLYIKSFFYTASNGVTLNKVWVTLFNCIASRAIILNLVPELDNHSFIKCFRRFVSQTGCPSFAKIKT